MIKKLIAFTLSEVLLVAGIIGVIGALTIPNMKKSYEKKARIAKAKADFYNLDTGLQQLEIQDVLRGTTGIEDRSLALLTALKEQVKFSMFCGTNSSDKKCFTSEISSTNDTGNISNIVKFQGSKCASAILNDNSEMLLCVINYSQGIPYGFILVDVDGASRGVQTRGEDVFYFEFSGNSGGSGLKITTSPEVDILN